MKLSPTEALTKLSASGKHFIELFSHGSLLVEIYKPDGIDWQSPHTRDELYVVIAGRGEFYLEHTKYTFEAGDFFFVPAGAKHHFENFTADFSTWVFFYGPEGGEPETSR